MSSTRSRGILRLALGLVICGGGLIALLGRFSKPAEAEGNDLSSRKAGLHEPGAGLPRRSAPPSSAKPAQDGGPEKSPPETDDAPADSAVPPQENKSATSMSPVVPPEVEEVEQTVPDEELDAWLNQAGKDTPGTIARVLALEDGVKRREILEWILAAWTSEDRGPALEWLKQSLPALTPETAGETMDLLIGAWAREEPEASIAWVERNLPASGQGAGLRIIAENWALTEPDDLAKWISHQKTPPPDLWVDELVQGLIPTDPAKALEWSGKLTDPALAESSRQGVIQSWLLTDPAEAGKYLQAHPDLVPENRPEEMDPAPTK